MIITIVNVVGGGGGGRGGVRGVRLGFQLIPSNAEALLYIQDPRKQEELRLNKRLDF